MNAFSRRGACPALSAPMQTGDGLLVRLNPVAGGLSPKALIGLCESAARHGNGIVEVTARGSIQIRGLTAESASQLADEVDTLGIAVRTGVPVETGPLAGLDPDEIADPRPLAEAIRAEIASVVLSARLGPKVSVIVDGGGRFGMDAVIADVRLVTVPPQPVSRGKASGPLWRLAIGGDAATSANLGTAPETEAPRLVLEILQQIAELGPEGRARDLPSPSWGTSANNRCAAEIARRAEGAEAMHPQPASLASLSRGASRDTPKTAENEVRPLGTIAMRQGHALAIALPFGSMPVEKIIGLACEAINLGATEIRPALGRMLIVPSLSEENSARLQDEASSLGFLTDPDDPRLFIAACPGAPACASGRLETRALAQVIASENAGLFDGSFTLHVSGCPKGCAHPGPAGLTLVGGDNGAGLVVNATAKDLPAGYTPRYDAARALTRVAAAIRASRLPGESAASTLARQPRAVANAFSRADG